MDSIASDIEFLFSIVNALTIDTEKYCKTHCKVSSGCQGCKKSLIIIAVPF